MQNYSYSGKSIAIVADRPITSGEVVVYEDLIGIASGSALPGEEVEIYVEEVYELPKEAIEIKNAKKVYWDLAKKCVTVKEEGNRLLGVSCEAAKLTQPSLRVRLNGVFL